MPKKIIILAALLISVPAWAGDLTVDNLVVNSNAAMYQNLNFYSITATTNTNGVVATGGWITTNGNYCIHTFTNVGTTNFIVSGGSLTCDVLVVAGGGGGGRWESGGGGGGGFSYTSGYTIASGEYAITVGAGGIGGAYNASFGVSGSNGNNSSFSSSIVSIGGGGGAGYTSVAGSGGSGGGSGSGSTPGTGTAGQGNDGGYGYSWESGYPGGGGGGAGAAGTTVTDGDQGGDGGAGLSSDISGITTYYSGGGGGSIWYRGGGQTPGAGGVGGGGDGSIGTGENGTANTGGGGGGGAYGGVYTGGSGGSGIVIVRYAVAASSNSYDSTLTVSSNGISQTAASGTNVFMAKVGIGTNTPAEQLHVAGNARVDGTNIVAALTLGGETRATWPEGNLVASNNLADITNTAAARANLGLGSAATNNADAFLAPTGDGSQLSGITAAQVGALSTNAGALIAANNLSDIADAGTARANLGALSATGNGSQLTGITADQVGALSTNGGAVNGDILLVAPAGNIPMGVYTNQ